MKNGIIALLFLLLVFLLLHVMGAFQYGSLTDHDYGHAFLNQRTEAVNKSPAWKIGIITNADNTIARETERGMFFARDYLNTRGGILGKNIELEIHADAASAQKTKLLTQEFCERADTALLIGGLNTEEIPSLRCITQYQGLPFVSPVASLPDSLPVLSPELTMSYFPPLSVLTEKITGELSRRGKTRILIISPGDDSYGGLFGTNLERRMHEDKTFAEIYRVNYKNPARFADMYQSLKLFTENRTIDAIVFTDDMESLEVLGEVIRSLGITTEIWGNDYLDVSGAENTLKKFPAAIYYTAFENCRLADPEFLDAWKKEFGTAPSLWNQLGAQCLLGFAEAVEQEKTYAPARLMQVMQERQNHKLARNKFQIDASIRKLKTAAPVSESHDAKPLKN